MPTPYSDKIVAEALALYVKNELTTKAIADQFGISASTLTAWAQHAKLPLRSRGRRTQLEPNARQKAILEMAEYATYEQVGQQFGCEKQAVHRMVKRWKDWTKPKRPPFEPGDQIKWRGKTYKVLAASQNYGTLIDQKGDTLHQFRWNQGGRLPTKVPVSSKS